MITMVKSSDSQLPVLDFARARNLRRACAVRKLGIWEQDCPATSPKSAPAFVKLYRKPACAEVMQN